MSIVALTMNYKQSMKKAARTKQGWVPPAEGQLLVNTDASFDEYSHSGSTGVTLTHLLMSTRTVGVQEL